MRKELITIILQKYFAVVDAEDAAVANLAALAGEVHNLLIFQRRNAPLFADMIIFDELCINK